MLRIQTRFTVFLFLIVVSNMVLGASYYGDGSYADTGIGIIYDDNLSRAEQDSDIAEDFITQFSAAYSGSSTLSQHSLLQYSIQGDLSRYDQYKDLNSIQLGGVTNFIYQPVNGFSRPWYEVSVSLGAKSHSDSDIRDSANIGLGLNVNKRITRDMLASIGYYYDHRFAKRDVFDTANHSVQADAEYSLFKGINLYSAYRVTLGEIVSTATPNATIMSAAESIAPDDVFSPGIGPGCMNRRCAYRLDALTHQVSLGLNLEVHDQVIVDFASKYHSTDATGDNEYEGLIHQANIWISF